MDPTDLLRLLVDPARLAVAGALAAGPGTTAQLADRAGVDERTAVEVVARLVQAGLASGDAADGYTLEPHAWHALARSVAAVVPEPGRRYHELEVNELLGAFHPDSSSLRRYLVDEGLLDRADNLYWRSGGRVV